MHKLSILFLAMMLVFSASAFSQTNVTSTVSSDSANLSAVVKSCNDFGFKLFRAAASQKEPRDNVLLSPLSAYVALTLAYNGAAGATCDSMAKAMGIGDIPDSVLNSAVKVLLQSLTQLDPAVTIDLANSLWCHRSKRLKQEFIDLGRDRFSADVRKANFLSRAAEDSINSWVAARTHNRIKNIVERSSLRNSTSVLLNALYFKGEWTYPFDSTHTRQEKFFTTGDSVIECAMMFRNTDEDRQLFRIPYHHKTFSYFENSRLQGVNLPYGKGGLCMSVLLPDSLSTIDSLVSSLSEANWLVWQNIPTSGSFYLKLPKFRFECEVPLKRILDTLGMGIVFDADADFSRMFGDSAGWISDARQKTSVEVSEKGTEAAAVTQLIFADSVPPSLIANRPFLFLIHDKETGLILFVGKVARPKW